MALIRSYNVLNFAGGKNKNNYEYRAIIGLIGNDGSTIGTMYFHRNPEATMPDTDEKSSDGRISLHYPANEFQNVLDILRNESPIYLTYVGGEWHTAYINAADEPVGEGELTLRR